MASYAAGAAASSDYKSDDAEIVFAEKLVTKGASDLNLLD